MRPASTLTAEEFFELVEALLGPPMADLGYHRIHGSVNDQPASRSSLTSAGHETSGPPFLRFEYGFEAGSDEVMRLVGPDDPLSQEEWWVGYEPSTGRLELDHWEPVAGGRLDWDIRRDDGPCPVAEVRRRLLALGLAVRAFVEQREGTPEH